MSGKLKSYRGKFWGRKCWREETVTPKTCPVSSMG